MSRDLNSEPNVGEFSTVAEWDFKSYLLSQYAIAYNNLANYIVEPHRTELQLAARKSIIKLLYPLYPKLYVLGDGGLRQERAYLAYFVKNPQELHMLELQAAFLILQRVMEKLGITKFERFQLNPTEIYRE